MEEISANLIQEIKRGNVVLFLGAGASMEAQDANGNKMYGVKQLIEKLSDRFLGGEGKSSSLASVAELAESESDLVGVQIFLKQLFETFEPAEFHLKIPLYRWKAIFSTNYDLIVEKAYASVKNKPKNLVPIYSSSDRMDSLIATSQDLPYIKLHGCINKIGEYDPPLILTVDQYVSHRSKREVLFERLKSLGASNTLLFIGHSLEDSDIRQILHEVNSITSSRPRYYALVLDYTSMQSRLWEGKKVSLMKGTFESFLNKLDEEVSEVERTYEPTHNSHPIERFFVSNDYELTKDSIDCLKSHLQFVHSGIPAEQGKPDLFYHGYSQGWSPIQENLDITRTISDEVVSQVILCDESERAAGVETFLITGSAGAGKSIIMRRIAWDSAIEYEKVCLFWTSNEKLNYKVIIEISEKVGERIFLFVDRAVMHVPDLLLMITKLKESKSKVTIILAERSNEWNIECSSLQKYLSDSFEVRYLGGREIRELIAKLEEHGCLGVLKNKTEEQRIRAFHDTAGRQLLVALHEATSAKSFSEIIQDEYNNIVPMKAQLIYRTVCLLNRLNVPVRAGIISRIHGVTFEDFSRDFFSPLENVVKVTAYRPAFDRAYVARHPLIAEMVYEYAFKSETDKFDNLMSILPVLDIGYSPDRAAFREFIKYRSLNDLFSDLDRIENIYEQAYKVCGDDDYYYQQKAIFYMRSAKQRLDEAEELLFLAKKYGPYNSTIEHTMAELELAKASKSKGLEREKHYNKASTLASNYTGSQSTSSHGYDTLLKITLARLEEALMEEDEELISELTRSAEESLRTALQKYPDDEILLSSEAKFATLISDNKRAFKALERAFERNTSNSYLASSLSKIYLSRGDIEKAKEVLGKVLESKPGDKIAHAKLGMLLVEHFPEDTVGAEHHLKRSFTDGDSNFVNQLWYARQLYLDNRFDEYLKLIQRLKSINMSPDSKHKLRGIVMDKRGKPINIVGKLVRKEATFALIESSGYSGTHFLHKSNIDSDKFAELKVGEDICYHLGFTFGGAAAVCTASYTP